MSGEINLIREKHFVSAKTESVRQLIYRLTSILLLLFVVVLGGSLIYFMKLNADSNKLNDDLTRVKQSIKELQKNEGIYMLLKQKSSSINQIISNRYPYLDRFDYLRNLENENIKINSIALSDTKTSAINVLVKDSPTLDQLTQTILQDANLKYRNIDIKSIVYQVDSSMVINLELKHL